MAAPTDVTTTWTDVEVMQNVECINKAEGSFLERKLSVWTNICASSELQERIARVLSLMGMVPFWDSWNC